MKNILDRTEVGKAINFGKYPVLTLDISDKDEYGLKGMPVRIDMGNFSSGEKWYEKATFRAFKDECKPVFTSGGCCLSATLSYSDVMEDIMYAQAPIVKPNSEFVLVLYNSFAKVVYKICILKTGDINKHCITPLTCEELDLKEYIF